MWNKINAGTALLGVVLIATGCRQRADAQVSADPYAPIRCFDIADDLEIASQSAIDLCAGATSLAPAACVTAAEDTGVLTTQQMIQLCRGATSNESFACFERLDAVGTLSTNQIVQYCGARCPVGPAPPEAGNGECLIAALDRADLDEQMGASLCLLATSTGPVDCFVAGEDRNDLTESQLIQLCAETPSCQYINAPAPVAE